MARIARKEASLITDDVIDSFFSRFLRIQRAVRIAELVIVSPWITPWVARGSRLETVVSEIRRRELITHIVTTFPAGASANSHWDALNQFRKCETVMITELPNLHAKFYVCASVARPFALIGSANMTNRSLSNKEIGILLDDGPNLKGLIKDLSELGKNDLPTQLGAKPLSWPHS